MWDLIISLTRWFTSEFETIIFFFSTYSVHFLWLCFLLSNQDTVCALILSTKVPFPFWGEAALHVVHAIKRILSPVIQIKLHMSAFLGHFQTITTFALSILPVSFFFSRMSITNLSLILGFVVFLAIAKLKRGIGVMILSLIIFVSPTMFSFGNIAHLSSSFTSVPPYLPLMS